VLGTAVGCCGRTGRLCWASAGQWQAVLGSTGQAVGCAGQAVLGRLRAVLGSGSVVGRQYWALW